MLLQAMTYEVFLDFVSVVLPNQCHFVLSPAFDIFQLALLLEEIEI